jgi:hypothetical protein
LDGLADASAAVVTESNSAVIVFGLSADNAAKVIEHAKLTSFFCDIADEEGTHYSVDEITESFGPYTVTINKPNRAGLQLLTNTGFRSYLNDERTETIWHIARLRTAIVTLGRIFLPWEKEEDFEPGPGMKNPRTLVKESSTSRTVASDIRPWILRSGTASLTCASSLVWVKACIAVCLRCLPDEVDAANEELRFKGPPKRSVGFYKASPGDEVDFLAFEYLQSAVTWIFELENQAEVRSLYFKAEVVRSGLPLKTDPITFLKSLDSALEGAKIAYAMSVSELGKDTVKALADLKKSITEDTAKLTDATRQTIGAVAAALAVGVGLLAARIAAKAPINLIGSIMIIVAVYIALIIMTGWNLVRLQRQLREDWHPKIYRFLTDAEYLSMVERPAKTAEYAFIFGASVGGVIVASLTIYICYLWLR